MSRFDVLMAGRPVILAPLEGYSDAIFRRICRSFGAEMCLTEFVNVDNLINDCKQAKRKMFLPPGDQPTAIQIYGADPDSLVEAAQIAEAAGPTYIDINCGCWVPKIVARGAGAGWLRDPEAMVAMAARVVEAVSLPVTVKTRIGWGPESDMPIVDLARRLEDAGVRALTIHCRTAKMGHKGAADWSWARKAREVVSIPVIVNGDINSAQDAERAFEETGCAGVMIGRRAIAHPWIFAETKAWMQDRVVLPPPTNAQRLALARWHFEETLAQWGERIAIPLIRRHWAGYLDGMPERRMALNRCDTLEGTRALLGSIHVESPVGVPMSAG